MAEERQNPSGEVSERAGDDRLESWKEIAGYLKRDVRTVQRWERADSLPIYRHSSGKLGGVYAYKAELDEWWVKARQRLEPASAPGVPAPTEVPPPVVAAPAEVPRALRIGWWSTAALVVAAGSLASTMWIARSSLLTSRAPASGVTFQARDWVLVAQFQNQTGDPTLDGVLEYALERELANSGFVNVVPRDRIDDALHLMKRPLDTVIDSAVGREVCLRDGAIKALITGRIDKLGPVYSVSSTVVDPTTGMTVGAVNEEAKPDRLPTAVRQVSNGIRRVLGETLVAIRGGEPRFEKATTASLRALALYSRAMTLGDKAQWATAEQLLKQAIADDPEFASAHILLAWALRNQRHPPEYFLPHAERAMQLATSVAEGEALFIRASYYGLLERDVEAIKAYEALLNLYPDHYWGTNNLTNTYFRLERDEQAVPLLVRLAQMRPNDVDIQMRAGFYFGRWRGDFREAAPYVQKVRRLGAENAIRMPGLVGWFTFYPTYERWVSGDIEAAAREVRAAEQVRSNTEAGQEALARTAGLFYLTLGKLNDAERAFRRIGPRDLDGYLAHIAFALGDHESERRQLASYVANLSTRGPLTAMLAARAQLPREAGIVIKAMEHMGPSMAGGVTAAKGELAFRVGQDALAIGLLRDAIKTLRSRPEAYFFLAVESLAEIYALQGKKHDAIRALEIASAERTRTYASIGPSGMFWMRTQAQLSDLYRQAGREREAAAIEADLLKLLQYADADFPLLREIQARPAVRRAG